MNTSLNSKPIKEAFKMIEQDFHNLISIKSYCPTFDVEYLDSLDIPIITDLLNTSYLEINDFLDSHFKFSKFLDNEGVCYIVILETNTEFFVDIVFNDSKSEELEWIIEKFNDYISMKKENVSSNSENNYSNNKSVFQNISIPSISIPKLVINKL